MNVSLNPNQSDTKEGAVAYPANANLTGYDNSLVKIVNNNGAANFALPAGTYYRFNDFYIDKTNAPSSVDIYLCVTAGTNSTAVWLLLFSTCT